MGVKNACNDNDFDVFVLVLGLKAGAELLVVDAFCGGKPVVVACEGVIQLMGEPLPAVLGWCCATVL